MDVDDIIQKGVVDVRHIHP